MGAGVQPKTAREALGVLGLDASADPATLRRAYLAGVKASHPDRPGGDAARLRAVIEAYVTLRRAPVNRGAEPAVTQPAIEHLEISPAAALFGGLVDYRPTGGAAIRLTLPAGLRQGDGVRVAGRILKVSVRGEGGAAVLGDHLCLTVDVDREVLRTGGRVRIDTPLGPRMLWISGQDAVRGFVRLPGLGLPARGRHARGHLFIRLRHAAAAPVETPARAKLRRFAAAWAA